MQQILPEINKLGAELVAISSELPDNSLSMAEKNALTFQVLSDQNSKYAKQCGLIYILAEELQPIYTNWGIDFQKTYGNSTFELPLPATYVVDQGSLIVLSFADADYTKRLEPSEVASALKAISS